MYNTLRLNVGETKYDEMPLCGLETLLGEGGRISQHS